MKSLGISAYLDLTTLVILPFLPEVFLQVYLAIHVLCIWLSKSVRNVVPSSIIHHSQFANSHLCALIFLLHYCPVYC